MLEYQMTINWMQIVAGWVVKDTIVNYLSSSETDDNSDDSDDSGDSDDAYEKMDDWTSQEINFDRETQLEGYGITLFRIPHDQLSQFDQDDKKSLFVGLTGKYIFAEGNGVPFVSLDSLYPIDQLKALKEFQQLTIGTKFHEYIADNEPKVFILQDDCGCCS